ncbi:MAG: fibrobacter succinogenes major paralogous domain-containing protein [Ferruginibacter sp.]
MKYFICFLLVFLFICCAFDSFENNPDKIDKKILAVSNYRNGEIIPQVTDPGIWGISLVTFGAWCWYNNDSATYSGYGKLYNWFAINDSRGLATQGWHIPTDAEWTTLSTCLGGEDIAGGALKETDTVHWASPNTAATNSSGFAGLPGGFRYINGLYFNIGNFGYWWSSSQNFTYFGSYYQLNYNGASVYNSVKDKTSGFSVRCVRD